LIGWLVQAGTVFVPDGTYLINALYEDGEGIALKSNMTLRLSAGATLKVIPNAAENYSTVSIRQASNVTVIGGTIQGDRYAHQGTGGEWGMGIAVLGSSNVVIEGVTAKELWGDGFYIDRVSESVRSRNVRLHHVVADRNRRQGMSIVDVRGAVVRDSVFQNTGGTAPSAGMDLEPDAGETVEGVQIIGCKFLKNDGDGLVLTAPFAHNPPGHVRNCAVIGNLMRGNGQKIDGHNGNGLALWNVGPARVVGNTLEDNRGHGIMLWTAHHIDIGANRIANNAMHGLWVINTSVKNTIHHNTVVGSSQALDKDYDNIHLADGASANRIQANICRAGNRAKRPAYGVHISSTDCKNNVVLNNDLRASGVSGAFANRGTGTKAAGNRR